MDTKLTKQPNPAWIHSAACRIPENANIFWQAEEKPGTKRRAIWAAINAAKNICETCPVKTECIATDIAEQNGQPYHTPAGVRGGLAPKERAQLYRQHATPKKTMPHPPHQKTIPKVRKTAEQIKKEVAADRARRGIPKTGIPTSTLYVDWPLHLI